MKDLDIFIICPVRRATPEITKKLKAYIRDLESNGNSVYCPLFDTDQTLAELEINENHRALIEYWADCVHVYYMPESSGIHFDLGMAFAHRRKITLINPEDFMSSVPEKSYLEFILSQKGEDDE